MGTPRPRIVFPDADAAGVALLDAGPRERLEAADLDLQLHFGTPANPQEWRERIEAADGVLLGWPLPSGVLSNCPNVQVVSFTGTGVTDAVDLEEAHKRGITVTNVTGYGDNAVAEHTVALLLSLVRDIPALDRSVRDGLWLSGEPALELQGCRLGLVGFGGIGSRVAAIAKALGMEVVAWTRRPDPARAEAHGITFVPLEELIQTSDVVSVHVALTGETHRLIDGEMLAMLKPGAVLINTARGDVLDEEAVVAALLDGRLAGAALDVFIDEPLRADHPLRSLDRVVLTPHVAFNTQLAAQALMDRAVQNLIDHFSGSLTSAVVPSPQAAR